MANEVEAREGAVWLVWANHHRMWWCADERGYTRFVENAGRYTLDQARQIVGSAKGGKEYDDEPNSFPRTSIQPSPELIETLTSPPAPFLEPGMLGTAIDRGRMDDA